MKIGERLLLIFMSVIFFGVVLCIGACVWSEDIMMATFEFIDTSIFIKIAITAVLLILAVLSFRSMFVSTGRNKTTSALAASTDEGAIYINLDTINDLASKAVKKIDDVREMKVRTVIANDGANIAVKVALNPESVIPEISARVQQSVKTDIEALCGIAVKKIIVQVDNSLQTQKTK